jgi:hypothetical protein
MESKESTEVRAETSEAGTLTAEPEVPQGCPAGAPAPQPIWASRSRKSIRAEEALQKELERCNSLRSRAEDAIRGLTEEKERALKLLKGGEAWSDAFLTDTLSKIEQENLKLEAFKEIAEKASSSLEHFRAGMAAYAPERSRIQNGLADLAGARLEIDHELERLLGEARAMLQVREETIAFMRRQAAAIDLKCSF